MKRLKRMKDAVLDRVLRRKGRTAPAAAPATRIAPEYEQLPTAPASIIDADYSDVGAVAQVPDGVADEAVYNNTLELQPEGEGATAQPPVQAGPGTQIDATYATTTAFEPESPAPAPLGPRERRAKALDWDTDAQGRLVRSGTRPLGRAVAADPLDDPSLASSSFNEDTRGRSEFDEGNDFWAKHDKTVTHRAGAADKARYATQVTDTGLLQRGGAALDTTRGHRTAAVNGRWMRQGQMFTMDEQGALSTADQAAEEQATGKRVHHSTLAAGDDVAGAGELQVRRGRVEAISDRSGHYKPDITQTHQALSHLAGQGVPLEGMHAVLGGKSPGEADLNVSAMELHAYGPEVDRAREDAGLADDADEAAHALQRPERQIRERHARKAGVLAELTAATSGMRRHLDQPADDSSDYGAEVTRAVRAAGSRPEGFAPRFDERSVAQTGQQSSQRWELPDPADGPNARATQLGPSSETAATPQADWEEEDDAAFRRERKRRAKGGAVRATYFM